MKGFFFFQQTAGELVMMEAKEWVVDHKKLLELVLIYQYINQYEPVHYFTVCLYTNLVCR